MIKIVGMIALSKFPMWKQTVDQMMKLCDKIVVRFDALNGDPEIVRQIETYMGDKLGECRIEKGWRGGAPWREECLEMVNKYQPDIVICPDEDELFADGIEEELKAFYYSDKDGMMFDYNPLVSDDRRIINNGKPYPDEPHMKAFRWKQGLSYFPYHRNAIIAKYVNPSVHWKTKTKINHYCAYTLDMEVNKHFRCDTPKAKARKAVTLVGFGPSSRDNYDIHGEIWSLNNAFDALRPESLRFLTRIYEMHPYDKRCKEVGKNGRPYFWNINKAGELGTRIIMQKSHDTIKNSESYPFDDIVARTGLNWFTGTPCYMVAQAIAEKYTEIHLYGLDQLDWEHTIQRECFAFWIGYAMGRGIKIGGRMSFVERFLIDGKMPRYGYDWGPEFNEWCWDKLWQGHPLSIKYKIPSRVVQGDLYDGIK